MAAMSSWALNGQDCSSADTLRRSSAAFFYVFGTMIVVVVVVVMTMMMMMMMGRSDRQTKIAHVAVR